MTNTAQAPWLTLVIVAFNSGDFTRSCVEALAAQSEGGFEAVIVVNADEDGGVAGLTLPDARFRIEWNAVNNGFSGGSNQALMAAQTPYVMTLNPDTILGPDCLKHLKTMTEQYPNAAMLGPFLTSMDGTVIDSAGDTLSAFGVAWNNGNGYPTAELGVNEAVEVFGPTGAAALYKRGIFQAAGGFDTGFFCYFEDVDLALRLRARGELALLVPRASGRHFGGHSTAALPGFAIEMTSRNVLTAIVKSAPWPLLPVILAMHLFAHCWFQRRNKGTNIARFRAKGFRAGIAGLPSALRQRLRRRPYPLGASWHVARRLSWRQSSVSRRTALYLDMASRK